MECMGAEILKELPGGSTKGFGASGGWFPVSQKGYFL